MRKMRAAIILTVSLSASLALAGCASPEPAPRDDASAPIVTTDTAPAAEPESTTAFHPDWPWPTQVPRPDGVFSEFSAANPLGDGGVWTIEFRASNLDEVQEFVNSLLASGWESMGGDAPMIDGNEAAWSMGHTNAMGSITVTDVSASPVSAEFSFMGTVD